MKRNFLILILVLTAALTAGEVLLTGCKEGGGTGLTGTVTVGSYDMDLKLNAERKTLSGVINMKFTNDTDGTLEELVLRNYAASILKDRGKGSAEIKTITAKDGRLLDFTVGKDPSVVTVDLGKNSLKKGESGVISVTYQTDIPKTRDRFGYTKIGDAEHYLLSFCFPIIAMLEDGKWNKNPYIYSAESTYNRVTDYRVRLEAPEEFLVAASGDETTKKGVTTVVGLNMRDMAITASNYMEVTTETAAGVKINNYTIKHPEHPDQPDYAGADTYNNFTMEAAKDSVKLFTEKIGKYPYNELDIIQCYDSGGMEYPGLILIGLPDIAPADQILEELNQNGSYSELALLVAHETAHQWFYGAVGNDQFAEAWLDESFAEYCENGLYGLSRPESLQRAMAADEEKSGQEQILFWDSDEDVAVFLPEGKQIISKAYDEYDEKDDYSWNVYQNGAYFLYELRRAVGDESFFAMLQEYYKTYYLKEAKGQNFIDMVYKYDDSDAVKKVVDKYIEL